MNTHHVDDEDGLFYCVKRVVVRKGVIVAYRFLTTAGKMGVENYTPIHISHVERMTKGVDSGDRSKSGDVRHGSSQEPLEANSQSLGPASNSSIPVEGLPLEQEPQSTKAELMAHLAQLTGVGLICGVRTASGVRTDIKRSRKPRELLNV